MDLAGLINTLKTANVRILTGVFVNNKVLIDGAELPCVWLNHVKALSGDKVLVAVTDSSGIVLGALAPSARPLFGRIASSSRGRVMVMPYDSTMDGTGKSIEVLNNGMALPSTGTLVTLDWTGNNPVITGVINDLPTVSTTPPPALSIDEPNPPIVISAIDAGTWVTSTKSWSDRFTGAVFQKDGSLIGAYFYDSSARVLRECQSLSIYLPARRRAGNMSAPATVRFQPHSLSAPSNPPQPLSVVKSFSIPAGWEGGWIPLGQDFARSIPANQPWGIALTGSDYIGFDGVASLAESGALKGEKTTI